MRSVETAADREALPANYRTEPRYLGYRAADRAQPYARFFRPRTEPVQDHVQRALVAGTSPAELGCTLDELPERLAADGYEPMETGWTTASGVLQVNVLTRMPRVTAQMWSWWFGWHGPESARYKLWNPDAHQFAALGEDRRSVPGIDDRARYIGNVSYVDEYIGGELHRLAIRFVEPEVLGIADRPGTVHICARVGLSALPVAFGWLVHQVRPTDDGAEMRSRFFLNTPQLLHLPTRAVSGPPAAAAVLSSKGSVAPSTPCSRTSSAGYSRGRWGATWSSTAPRR